MRNELHQGVSQQLLGAAFGCKVLAGKVATLSEELGKEASDLAELVNGAVIELQNLVQSNENQVDGEQPAHKEICVERYRVMISE